MTLAKPLLCNAHNPTCASRSCLMCPRRRPQRPGILCISIWMEDRLRGARMTQQIGWSARPARSGGNSPWDTGCSSLLSYAAGFIHLPSRNAGIAYPSSNIYNCSLWLEAPYSYSLYTSMLRSAKPKAAVMLIHDVCPNTRITGLHLLCRFLKKMRHGYARCTQMKGSAAAARQRT
jgi:hypothetical protein